MAKLVVLSEGFAGRSYELQGEKTTVGRLDDNNFHLSDQSVSSRHCEILLRGNDVVVKDLNSTNGTYINGEKVSEAVLKPGQILRLGSIELKLDAPGAVAASPEPSKAKTRQISGVQAKDFDAGSKGVKFDKNSPFAKKRNKTNMIFMVVGGVLGVVILTFLLITFLKMKGGS